MLWLCLYGFPLGALVSPTITNVAAHRVKRSSCPLLLRGWIKRRCFTVLCVYVPNQVYSVCSMVKLELPLGGDNEGVIHMTGQKPALCLTCRLEDSRVTLAVTGGKRLHHAVNLLGFTGQTETPQELPVNQVRGGA